MQPDDGLLGLNVNNNSWNTALPDGRQVCVHAFIGKLVNGDVATYQTLPWSMVVWHSGVGSEGSANNMGYIGFEICEDGLADASYFNKVYKEAAELCAYLFEEFDLNPLEDIICHSEGYKLGIASNHSDVMHWFPKHGKSMDTFRADVKAAMIPPTHWAESSWQYLNNNGVTVHERRFDDNIMRGEVFVLLEKVLSKSTAK